jgi:hypothetical protein
MKIYNSFLFLYIHTFSMLKRIIHTYRWRIDGILIECDVLLDISLSLSLSLYLYTVILITWRFLNSQKSPNLITISFLTDTCVNLGIFLKNKNLNDIKRKNKLFLSLTVYNMYGQGKFAILFSFQGSILNESYFSIF